MMLPNITHSATRFDTETVIDVLYVNMHEVSSHEIIN